jgi:thiol-disulfide isomerase/thioredoxin
MKFKKFLSVLIIVMGVLLLSSCSIGEEEVTDAVKFKEEYEELNGTTSSSGKEYPSVNIDSDNVIVYSSLEEVLDILDSGTGVIYLGYPTCPWCRNAVPVLLKASDNTSLDKIYYVNMTDVRDKMELDSNNSIVTTKEADKEYYELLEKLDDILLEYTLTDDDGNEYDTQEKRVYVPTVLFVYNGKVVDYHFDTVDSQTDPYVVLDEEQTLELYNIYLQGIHKVLNDQCDDSDKGEEHC